MSHPNVRVFENPQQLAEAAAEVFAKETARSIRETGRFAVALAGGSTPKRTYELLATEYGEKDLDWGKVHIFFGDERTVPPNHEDSNYLMAHEVLLSHIRVGSTHRMRGELDSWEAAALYEEELVGFFGGPPRFDLILLGIGEDGHTASLFPRTPALGARDRWVVENRVEKLGTLRLTLTVPAINAARKVIFLVAGEGKAEALKEILECHADPYDYPAKLIRPASGPVWMADRTAALLLD
ncbi:MAG TPA: 6-phosphogluconolactonase [Rubrobacteraceae bacterium]|nr:6-phosphogluconolactonase [Rubrobacteraceae bacterium]